MSVPDVAAGAIIAFFLALLMYSLVTDKDDGKGDDAEP